MTKEELDEAIGGNKTATRHITASELANIMEYVPVELKLDRKTLDNYYRIGISELLNSKMPVSDLNTLKEQGWAYDGNRESIIIFLT